jgi:hypothetical protein
MNQIIINNEKKSAYDSSGKKQSGESTKQTDLVKSLQKFTNADDALYEAFLVVDNKNKSLSTAPVAAFKYPHHKILFDRTQPKLVVDVESLKNAYMRAQQQGIYEGDVKDHIDKHYKALGLPMNGKKLESYENGLWNKYYYIEADDNPQDEPEEEPEFDDGSQDGTEEEPEFDDDPPDIGNDSDGDSFEDSYDDSDEEDNDSENNEPDPNDAPADEKIELVLKSKLFEKYNVLLSSINSTQTLIDNSNFDIVLDIDRSELNKYKGKLSHLATAVQTYVNTRFNLPLADLKEFYIKSYLMYDILEKEFEVLLKKSLTSQQE